MLKEFIIAGVTVIAVSGAVQADVVKGLNAFHRSGQTFITWQEIPAAKDVVYNVYRSGKPITSETLASAELVAARVPTGSGVDAIAARETNDLILTNKKDPVGPDLWLESVIQQKNEVKPRGYVVSTLGKPLPLGTGLCVHTVGAPGASYYAVTPVDASGAEDQRIVAGENSLDAPIEESVATPEPVFEKTLSNEGGVPVRQFVQWADRETAYRDGHPQKFKVQIGSAVREGVPCPLVVLLHGGSCPDTLPTPLPYDNCILLLPDDFIPGAPHIYDFWYGYNSNCGGDLTKGVNTNYTEKRLLRMIEWAKAEFPVDPNRVYLTGGSMGGTGGLIVGLRHPEVIAAIFANVPDTDTGLGISSHDGWFQAIWGTREQAVKTNEGDSIWDHLNSTAYVSDPSRELPFVKTLSSRDDPAIPWQQVPPFIKAMRDSRHGFLSGWGIGGHNMAFETRPMQIRTFDTFKIARNVSFPAFSNSSMDDDPGSGDPKEGTPTGCVSAGFDWTIVSDTPKEWAASILVDALGRSEAVTDITPRRLQQFKPKPGGRYSYTVTSADGQVAQKGEVVADKWGLVTLQGIRLTSAAAQVRIEAR